MRRGAPFAAAALAALGLGLGCREDVTAPGRCPELCPSARVEIVDTTLTGVVTGDTAFRGYVAPLEAPILIASDRDSLNSVVVVRFSQRASQWYPSTNDTLVGIGRVDSVLVNFYLMTRDTAATKGLRIILYRLPTNIDTGTTRAGLEQYLADSLLVDSVAVPDSVVGGTFSWRLRTQVLDTIPESQSGVVELAYVVRASQPATVAFASSESLDGGPHVQWYVHAPAPRDTVSHIFLVSPVLDFFAYDPPAPMPANELRVGGLPSARAILHFALPAEAVDSQRLVRATLLLTPTRPVTGMHGETFRLSARGLVHYFGAKSIIYGDTAAGGTTPLAVGDSAEIRIEVGRMLRLWGTTAGDSLPRYLELLAEPEGNGIGEVAVARYNAGAAAPRLRLTYIRPYTFGVP